MPITNIHFADGIFYCHEDGDITVDDANLWVQHAENYASTSSTPIVALIDATRCTFIAAKARTLFARARANFNIHCIVVASSDVKVRQNIELIAMMARHKQTHIFNTLEAAAAFAYEQAAQLNSEGTGV